jgi:3-oxoacyl-[acyl-carrier protein] reductase
MELRDKVAVITGASKGIGKAIAKSLAQQGCNVVLNGRNKEDLKAAEKEISQLGVKVLTIAGDVRNSKDVDAMAKVTEHELGPATILVNNAGIGQFNEVAKMSDDEFRAVLETNLFGVFYCCRAFLPGMIQKEQGHIINIASLAGKNPFAGGSAYCASKAALISFAECMMLEVRHHNIKVTTICPGSVQTDFGSGEMNKRNWALTSEDCATAVLDVLTTSQGSLISMVDLRPLKPPKR